MNMTPKELADIIACGETSTVQFKREYTSARQFAEEIVAFANSKGGMIVIGVEDKTGEVLGGSYEQIQSYSHEIATVANDFVRPVVYLQTEVAIVADKRLLIVHVAEGTNKPYKTIGGIIWVKQGPDKRRIIENNEILSLFQESGSYRADEAVIPGTGITDLETAYVNDFFQNVYGRPKEAFGVPVAKLLTSLGILGNAGQVTRAGMLFFGRYPQMKMPTYTIKAVAFYGNEIGGSQYRDSRDIIGVAPQMFREGMAFLKSNLHHLQAGQNFNSVGKLEIPEVVLEELLQNALVHVDLLGSAYIRLLVFDNRIEIINPGGLFGGLTVDDIRLGKSKQRNHLMAELCARTMLYRGLGSGIPRVLKENVKVDFISDVQSGDFRAIVWRNVPLADDRETIRQTDEGSPNDSPKMEESSPEIEISSPEMGEGLPKTKALIVALMKEKPKISTAEIAEKIAISKRAVIKHTNDLQAEGIIRHVGSKKGGHWEVMNGKSE